MPPCSTTGASTTARPRSGSGRPAPRIEYTFTRTLLGAEPLDDGRWLVRNHLEGDFPGGAVDLRYEFALTDGLISRLVIAP